MKSSESFEPFGPNDPLRNPVKQAEQKNDHEVRLKNPTEYVQRLLQLAHQESATAGATISSESATIIPVERTIDEWHWPIQMAGRPVSQPSLRSNEYEVIAPYRSSAEDAVMAGTRIVELRRSTNRIWTLRVEWSGPAAKNRLMRFTVKAPLGGEPWRIVCFIGTDVNGIGELSLSRFDSRRQWGLAPGCTFVLESLLPQELQPGDRDLLVKSCNATLTGRDTLEAILAAMPIGSSAE